MIVEVTHHASSLEREGSGQQNQSSVNRFRADFRVLVPERAALLNRSLNEPPGHGIGLLAALRNSLLLLQMAVHGIRFRLFRGCFLSALRINLSVAFTRTLQPVCFLLHPRQLFRFSLLLLLLRVLYELRIVIPEILHRGIT